MCYDFFQTYTKGCGLVNRTLIQKTISQSTIVLNTHGYNSHHQGHVFSFKSHDFDLLYTINGSFRYTMNGVTYCSEQNDIVIVPPNVLFEGEALTPCYHIFSHFSLVNSANRQLSFDFDDCRLPHQFTTLYDLVRTYYDKYHHSDAYSEAYGLVLKLILIEMILASERNRLHFSRTNNFDLPDVLVNLANYIAEHYKEALSVDELAQISSLSTATLNNYFSRFLSTTPSKYIEKLKMKYAMDTLSQPNASIAELAEELHYSDRFAFSKSFKRFTNYTPKEYHERFCTVL